MTLFFMGFYGDFMGIFMGFFIYLEELGADWVTGGPPAFWK